ncbi:MAG: hypothetical protein PHX72_02165 [Candidatus Shapirobacteria bacterium]|nr:hypothetical protein [Candidatus Shapirobacteria bacterium]
MIKTKNRHQRRKQAQQAKHGAWVTSSDRKIYNQAYQSPKNKNRCSKIINKA